MFCSVWKINCKQSATYIKHAAKYHPLMSIIKYCKLSSTGGASYMRTPIPFVCLSRPMTVGPCKQKMSTDNSESCKIVDNFGAGVSLYHLYVGEDGGIGILWLVPRCLQLCTHTCLDGKLSQKNVSPVKLADWITYYLTICNSVHIWMRNYFKMSTCWVTYLWLPLACVSRRTCAGPAARWTEIKWGLFLQLLQLVAIIVFTHFIYPCWALKLKFKD